jgi:hypothetical protein
MFLSTLICLVRMNFWQKLKARETFPLRKKFQLVLEFNRLSIGALVQIEFPPAAHPRIQNHCELDEQRRVYSLEIFA